MISYLLNYFLIDGKRSKQIESFITFFKFGGHGRRFPQWPGRRGSVQVLPPRLSQDHRPRAALLHAPGSRWSAAGRLDTARRSFAIAIQLSIDSYERRCRHYSWLADDRKLRGGLWSPRCATTIYLQSDGAAAVCIPDVQEEAHYCQPHSQLRPRHRSFWVQQKGGQWSSLPL